MSLDPNTCRSRLGTGRDRNWFVRIGLGGADKHAAQLATMWVRGKAAAILVDQVDPAAETVCATMRPSREATSLDL